MQARNKTMAVDHDEAQIGQAEPTTRERTPRFKLIKLEERIAPGGVGGISGKTANTQTFSWTCPPPPPTTVC
jgi:hypothetical protein